MFLLGILFTLYIIGAVISVVFWVLSQLFSNENSYTWWSLLIGSVFAATMYPFGILVYFYKKRKSKK